MWGGGGAGGGEEDAWSERDLGVVVRECDYDAVREELRGTCERLCGEIVGWLPEGEAPGFCNFAFLFEVGEEVLLCDLLLLTAGGGGWRRGGPAKVPVRPGGVLRGGGGPGGGGGGGGGRCAAGRRRALSARG